MGWDDFDGKYNHQTQCVGGCRCPRDFAKQKDQQIKSLFDAVKHGDEAHQAWLKDAIEKHFGLSYGKPRSLSPIRVRQIGVEMILKLLSDFFLLALGNMFMIIAIADIVRTLGKT